MHVAEIATQEVLKQFEGGEIILTTSSGHNTPSKGVLNEVVDVNDNWTRVLITVTHHGIGTINDLDVIEWKESIVTNASPVTLQSHGSIRADGHIVFDNDREPRRSTAVLSRA